MEIRNPHTVAGVRLHTLYTDIRGMEASHIVFLLFSASWPIFKGSSWQQLQRVAIPDRLKAALCGAGDTDVGGQCEGHSAPDR